MAHLEVSGLYDEDAQQRKSSISFDKIKQISLTYSLQSEEDENSPDDENNKEDTNLECSCRRESSCSSSCPLANEPDHLASMRKPSVIEVKKSASAKAEAPANSLGSSTLDEIPAVADRSHVVGKSTSAERSHRREENPSFSSKDQDIISSRTNSINNSTRYLRSNPFTNGDQTDFDEATIDGSAPMNGVGVAGYPPDINDQLASPNRRLFDARGAKGAGVYNNWPIEQDLRSQSTKQRREFESKLGNLYNDDSDHTLAHGKSLPGGSHNNSKLNDETEARIFQSPVRDQLISPSKASRATNYRVPMRTTAYTNSVIGTNGYPIRMLNGGDNSSLGLRLRQHNNSVVSLVVYNDSDANVIVSDDPESCSDESFWGSAAIETESAAIGSHHNENVQYSSDDEFIDDHNHQLILRSIDLNTSEDQIRDTNNGIRNMTAAMRDKREKQTPQRHHHQQQPYPVQRPSNRRVESLSQHDLENQAARRSVGSQYGPKAETTTVSDNGYHPTDSESMSHLNRVRRQPASDLERNLQAASHRQSLGTLISGQARNKPDNQGLEGQLLSSVQIDRDTSSSTTTNRVGTDFENIRSAINDGAQFPALQRVVQYQGYAHDPLLAR